MSCQQRARFPYPGTFGVAALSGVDHAPGAIIIFSVDAPDDGARILVQIVDSEPKAQVQARQLQIIFELTDAETRVAALIGNGMSLPEIARSLGISVKTRSGGCFAKAEVRSQAALARLIASEPVPDGTDIAPFK